MARAKRTVRAEARRRYRAEHPQAASEFDAEVGDGSEVNPEAAPAPRQGPTAKAPGASGPGGRPVRPSTLGAFRAAYQPADFRADFKALPELLRSRAVTIPVLLVLISTVVLILAVQTSASPPVEVPGASDSPAPSASISAAPSASSTGPSASPASPSPSPGASAASASPGASGASPAASGASPSPEPSGSGTGSGSTVSGSPLGIVASILALLFLGIPSPPAIGGIYLAAILAKRSSYLAGGIAGLVGSTGALAAVIYLSPNDAGTSIALFGQILATSVVFGIVIGAGLGYYRRLLRLMNPTPNRPANRPTNRSKQPARRR